MIGADVDFVLVSCAVQVKKEDVELLINELEMEKVFADRLLRENGGDIFKSIRTSIRPENTVEA